MKLADLYKRGLIVALACAALLVFTLPASAATLPGDCDGANGVTLVEVQGAINMFLGTKTATSCVDTDANGVTIAEVRNVVNAYLGLPVMVPALPVTGVAKDPVTGLGASGATVTAYADANSTPAATATVASDGSYTLSGLSANSTYRLVFSKTGYGEVTYYGVKPSQSAGTTLDQVLMLTTDKLSLTTSINGYILKASDNAGAALTLRFRAGIGATTGDYFLSKTADGYGYYARDYFPAGCYTVEVVKVVDGVATSYGFFTVYSVPGVSIYNNSQNFTVDTGATPSTTYRAVLSWGSTERDLDLHVTGPLNPDDTFTTIGSSNTPRFHVGTSTSDPQVSYPYGSAVTGATLRNIPGAATEAYLDQDQSDHGVDNGSETFTILTQQAGIYRVYVYNNSAAGYLAESGAQLKLYRGTTLVKSYTVPNKSGNTWTVFELNGDAVTDMNTMTTVDPTQTYNMAKPVAGYPSDELSTFKQVQKPVPAR